MIKINDFKREFLPLIKSNNPGLRCSCNRDLIDVAFDDYAFRKEFNGAEIACSCGKVYIFDKDKPKLLVVG